MSIPKTFESVVSMLVEAKLQDVNVSDPCRVVSYDRTKQRLQVQPLVARGVIAEGGVTKPDHLPIINDVPIVFPGNRKNGITWPVRPGDTVLVVYCSRSIDRWLYRGGRIDPKDYRRHNHNDAIAIPGLNDFAHALPPTAMSDDAMVIRFDNLLLGGALALDGAVRLTDLQRVMIAITAAIASLTATATVPSLTGAATLTALQGALVSAGFPSASPSVKLE